jgi:uncharacterized protein YidB (DUF937 family)
MMRLKKETPMASELFSTTIGNRNPRILEENLSAFAHRFPVSGRIVHAIAQETGGVVGLAERLEKNGLWDDAQQWMVTGKPGVMPPETIAQIFEHETIEAVARSLGIPRESVEIQAALGIPKFFTSLALDDEDDELGFGYGSSKKKKKSSAKASQARRGVPAPP